MRSRTLSRDSNVRRGKRSSGENVVMVDPLEAKHLAAKQMQEIRAKEKLKVHCCCIGVHHYNNNNNNNNKAFKSQTNWGRLELKPNRSNQGSGT